MNGIGRRLQEWLRGLFGPPKLLLVLALFGFTASDIAAVPSSSSITTSHGYAVFGTLKYGPDFTHLEYANPDAPKGGTYRYAAGSNFDSLNHLSLLGTYPQGLLYLYEPLMDRSLDEPASYYGVLAKTITYPADLSWVEFELRPEARWQDGVPVTADDVLFTVETLRGDLIAPQYGRVANVISRAEKLSDHRVRMELVHAENPTLPAIVANMPVLPKHYLEGMDLTRPSLDVPLSSGPLKVGKVVPGRSIDYERVEDYWGKDLPLMRGRFNFDTIRHLYYRDTTLQNEAFLAGLVDVRFEGSATRWRNEDKAPPFASGDIKRELVDYAQGVFFNALTINTRRPFLADRRVREALTYAYDFEWTRRVVLGGHHGRTASYFANTEFAAEGAPSAGELALLEPHRDELPAEVFDAVPPLPISGTRDAQRKNLLKARQLLLDAGYRYDHMRLVDPNTGEPIRLELLAYGSIVAVTTTQYLRSLERLGIEVDFRVLDTAQFRHRTSQYDFDLVVAAPSFPPNIAPGFELRSSWSSASADTPNTQNYAGIREPAIDAAVEAVINANNRRQVVDAMRVIDRIARANHYVIPFQHTYPAPVGQVPVTYWNRFGRPPVEPGYNFPFMTMDHWWVDPAKEAALSHGAWK